MAEAMDLCVACKGCKRECEANVDMALIKAEYLAQHAAHSGLSLRGRLFAHLPRWLHRSPWLKGLIRWRNDSPLLARLGQRLLGIAADRPLPEPAPWPFGPEVSAARNHQTPAGDGLPEVVLFVDTFSRHFEPGIARAAVAVLRAGGYRVLIAEPLATDAEPARPLCCGRTYLAQGMVDAAREEVERLMDALFSVIDAGCCGMAGTFGLEAEHADMASAMAELLSAALAD